MRAFTVATVAHAVGANPKWIDNLLSHHAVPGVTSTARGVTRRLEPEAIRVIDIAHTLATRLGVPLSLALAAATNLAATGRYVLSDTLTLQIDRDKFNAGLRQRLLDATETVPVPKRGRPPKHRADRTHQPHL